MRASRIILAHERGARLGTIAHLLCHVVQSANPSCAPGALLFGIACRSAYRNESAGVERRYGPVKDEC